MLPSPHAVSLTAGRDSSQVNRITAFCDTTRKNVIAFIAMIVLAILAGVVVTLDHLSYWLWLTSNRVALRGLRISEWTIHTLELCPVCNVMRAEQPPMPNVAAPAQTPAPSQPQVVVSQPTKFVS